MKKVFVIDNYDSFTYNLVHYLEELDCEVTVKRNDQFELDELEDYPLLVGLLAKDGPAEVLRSLWRTSRSRQWHRHKRTGPSLPCCTPCWAICSTSRATWTTRC